MGLVSDSGNQALNLPSEIPLYYWGVAQLYKVFGPHESIFRGINTFIFLSGLVAFTYSLWLVSGSLLWALFGGALLFTSPLLVYYGNNYLSNAPAFGMALLALAMFSEFFRTKRKKYWWWSLVFFLFAGSLKLPGLFLFFAIAGMVILFPKQFSLLNRKTVVISALIILTPILSWLIYARSINEAHHTVYFSTTIFPLWELSSVDISYILSEIKKLWLKDYGHWSFFLFFFTLFLSTLFPLKTSAKPWRTLILILIPGLLLFSILQFYTFMQHDYYLINMYILFPLILIGFSFSKANSKLFKSPFLLIGMAILLAFNVNYAADRHQFRYEGFHNVYRQDYSVLYDDIDQWLGTHGVTENDSVIFVSDDSHTSLYLLKRYGWTTHKMAFKDSAMSIYFNRTAEGINHSIQNGASHLIVLNWRDLYGTRSYLVPFTHHLVAQKEELMLFDLRDTNRNFELAERQVYREIILEPDSLKFPDNKVEVIEMSSAVSGMKVAKIGSEDIFNLTTDLTDLSPGMIVEFSAWVNADPARKVIPVISSLEPGLLFSEDAENIGERKDWRQLKLEYVVSDKAALKGLRCFIWNPDGATANLDAMVIRIYYPL